MCEIKTLALLQQQNDMFSALKIIPLIMRHPILLNQAPSEFRQKNKELLEYADLNEESSVLRSSRFFVFFAEFIHHFFTFSLAQTASMGLLLLSSSWSSKLSLSHLSTFCPLLASWMRLRLQSWPTEKSEMQPTKPQRNPGKGRCSRSSVPPGIKGIGLASQHLKLYCKITDGLGSWFLVLTSMVMHGRQYRKITFAGNG